MVSETRIHVPETGRTRVFSDRSRTKLGLLALGVLFFGVYLVQKRIDETYGQYRATEDILYIQDGKLLKRLLIGYENVAADIYWLRAVQYFGGKRREIANKNFDLLEPLLRITIDLNPDLLIAYTYGATFLSEGFPHGAGKPEKGIALIDEGIKRHPERWRFYLDKGFIYYWYLQEHDRAAAVFKEGSRVEGAPYWMVAMAGRAATEGGKRSFAREMWTLVYETAENDQIRWNAKLHLDQLVALDQMTELEALLTEYKKRFGAFPRNWGQMVSANLLRSVPLDPTGQPYLLDTTMGWVDVSAESALGRMPKRDREPR